MNPVKPLKLPVVSCDKMPNIMVKVLPTLNAYGSAVLRPSVYPSTFTKMINETGSSANEEMNDIILEASY